MIELEHVTSLKEYLQTAQSVAVILGPKPTADQAAVAAALTLGVAGMGKDVGVYAPRQLDNFPYAGLKNLQTELGKQNLVVEFDYDENAVDKVSYHIGEETKKFFLTIRPKKGQKPLDSSSVRFSYAGASADAVFLVGVHELESLEQLYFGYEGLYENAFVVTFHTFKPELGTVQLDLSGRSSMSEAVVDIMESLGMMLGAEMATDLLAGIDSMTQGLHSLTVTAETFEIVAKLMRAGGRRKNILNQKVLVDNSSKNMREKVVKKGRKLEKPRKSEKLERPEKRHPRRRKN